VNCVLEPFTVEAPQHAPRANNPDRALHAQAAARAGRKRAVLTVARKIGRRAYHVLRELEVQATPPISRTQMPRGLLTDAETDVTANAPDAVFAARNLPGAYQPSLRAKSSPRRDSMQQQRYQPERASVLDPPTDLTEAGGGAAGAAP
jgi:hypothetical protein